jgi:hypothetical protein
MIGYIVAIVLSFQLGYEFKKYRQMRAEKRLRDECERLFNEYTSQEAIEKDVDKQMMEKELKEKLDKEKILYSDLDKYIKGVK